MHEYQIVEAGVPLTTAAKGIILLHGRGGTASDLFPLARQLADESYYLVAPQATGRTWYPYGFMAPISMNQPWLDSAVDTVSRLIEETSAALGAENLYIIGFSQGACLCLEVTARHAQRYAGVAALTGGLIGEVIEASKFKGDLLQTPIFIGNSDRDPHVPLGRSKESAELLEQMGAKVSMHVYPGKPHTITAEEIKGVKALMF